MAVSSAVIIDATEGSLPPQQKSEKTAPRATPASDSDPDVYTGRDYL